MLTIIEKVLLLQNIDLFSNVTTEQLSFLAVLAREMPADAGYVIYREEDAPDGLYVVVSGLIAMERGGEEIERMGQNSSFGAWALVDDQTRLTTAKAVENSLLLFVSRDDFYEVLADHVDIIQALFKHLVERLRRLASVVEA